MSFKLTPHIKLHPRLSTGVVFEVLRDGFAIECGTVVKSSLEEAVVAAKERIANLFPNLSLEGLDVHVSAGG